jgi:glycosyltransferase involved in cell wall biosynthesis
MTTFNGEKYIEKQIYSILQQISDTDELIISDDGSTDATLNIITAFNDKRIKVLHHIKKKGSSSKQFNIFRMIAENFENAPYHARGDYIFLSDQDDMWIPHKAKAMLDSLQHFDLVMCNINLIDENDLIIKYDYLHKNPISKSFLLNIIYLPFRTCCMAFNRRLLRYILPFPSNAITCNSWIGVIASRFGKVGYLQESLHQYRIHHENISRPFQKSKNSLFFKIKYRLDLLNNILTRANMRIVLPTLNLPV